VCQGLAEKGLQWQRDSNESIDQLCCSPEKEIADNS